jgi:hypothetical protein
VSPLRRGILPPSADKRLGCSDGYTIPVSTGPISATGVAPTVLVAEITLSTQLRPYGNRQVFEQSFGLQQPGVRLGENDLDWSDLRTTILNRRKPTVAKGGRFHADADLTALVTHELEEVVKGG